MKITLTTLALAAALAAPAFAAETTAPAAAAPATTATATAKVTIDGGTVIEDVKVGTGAVAKKGSAIRVHYTGKLTNGNKFDSSYDRNEPIALRLGAGMVIPGWDKGLEGMKVGGKRILTIPPDQAYGPEGRPPVIPPNSTLIFETEMVEVN